MLRRFLQRTGFSLRHKTSVAQKYHERLIDKLVSFVLSVRRLKMNFNYELSDIIAMDETPVFETTVDVVGAKTVTMKTTGHGKCRLSVCLSVKACGSKLPPMMVFKGAKREAEALNKEFRKTDVR